MQETIYAVYIDGEPSELISGNLPKYNDIWEADGRRTFREIAPSEIPKFQRRLEEAKKLREQISR